ncbi:MAG: phosphotransferase family protein [Rhizobiales bacterium 65-9]|nr:MAG: phosphotransferase family protein [Rhizobiales bacterium 65-9]
MATIGMKDAEQISGFSSAALRDWLDANGIGDGSVENLRVLAGGTQNVLVRFDRSGASYVLRRGPMSLRAESNRTMMREARLLRALRDTSVPHPHFVAGSEDASIVGASFYVMKAVEGFNATVDPSPQMRADPATRHRMGLSLVSALGELSRLDPITMGLSDFGKLDGFLERQVGRWAAQLNSYEQYPEWTGRADLAGVEDIGAWLSGHRPSTFTPGIIHGDYHIGNVIYRDHGEVAAIVDWEMATLGDPLVDLGRILSTWPDKDGSQPLSMRVEPWKDFPDRDELVERYGNLTRRDLRDLRWFEILSCYKLAAILEGTYARAQAGKADVATGERLHRSAIALLSRALRWCES